MTLQKAERLGRKYLNPVPTKVGELSTMWKVLPEVFFGGKARVPRQPLGPFSTDARIYAQPPASGLRVTWMGHSTLLVEMDGVRILIDPVWDERAAPVQWAGPKRFFAPPLALDALPPLDAVLISHDHFDHLGAGTVRALAGMEGMRKTRWITSRGVGSILEELGVAASRCTELDWTESNQVGPVLLTALPARHFSGRSLFNRFETLWSSFALTGQRHRVYYGADSGEWPGFAEIGRSFGPFDLTMLEIGAFDRLWAEIHMGPEGAARSFRAMGGHGLLMPIHWGLFDLALHAWQQPIETISAMPGLQMWSPAPGEPTEVVAGEEVRSQWWKLDSR